MFVTNDPALALSPEVTDMPSLGSQPVTVRGHSAANDFAVLAEESNA
jgi:hypothetical protein